MRVLSGSGSIPACAGEPLARWSRRERLGVYPRVCGGTRPALHRRRPTHGLSPRVRGNLVGFDFGGDVAGSIPACAGEPCGCGCGCLRCGVYPRVCGGTSRPPIYSYHPEGLSPRVRGNLPSSTDATTSCGSIPACAGEPGGRSAGLLTLAVYPRVCGGTHLPRGNRDPRQGLSPRVRGNPEGRVDSDTMSGSIPACAGEPAGRQAARRAQEGLSPRVRGNPGRPADTPGRWRSIPACAGEPAEFPGSDPGA